MVELSKSQREKIIGSKKWYVIYLLLLLGLAVLSWVLLHKIGLWEFSLLPFFLPYIVIWFTAIFATAMSLTELILWWWLEQHRHQNVKCPKCGSIYSKRAGVDKWAEGNVTCWYRCLICNERFSCLVFQDKMER